MSLFAIAAAVPATCVPWDWKSSGSLSSSTKSWPWMPPGPVQRFAAEVGMREVHAGVDDRDDLPGAARDVPGGEHADARRPAESPELAEVGVVRVRPRARGSGSSAARRPRRAGAPGARPPPAPSRELHELYAREQQRLPERDAASSRASRRSAATTPGSKRTSASPGMKRCPESRVRSLGDRARAGDEHGGDTRCEYDDELAGHQATSTVTPIATKCHPFWG